MKTAEAQEEWRSVIGYEGWYEVSNLARVKRVRAGKGTVAGYKLRPALMQIGYHIVCLSKNSSIERYKKYVHHLVAEAFIGPRPSGYQINHIDGNKANSLPSNLEYITVTENARHAQRIGLCPRGSQMHGAKLTDRDVRVIRRLHFKVTERELAKWFRVSPATVGKIQTRHTWKHVI